MGLLTLPFLPVSALVRLAEIIRDEAERQWRDPAAARRRLEAAERARASGELSDEEVAEVERAVMAALTGGPVRPAEPPGRARAQWQRVRRVGEPRRLARRRRGRPPARTARGRTKAAAAARG